MADNKLRYYITGNASGLNKALNSASARVNKFGQKMKSVGASLQRFAAIGALAGGSAIKMAMVQLFLRIGSVGTPMLL